MRLISALLAATIFFAASSSRAQDRTTAAGSTTATTSSPNKTNEASRLVFWNRNITVFRSYLNQQSPADRAARANERLATLPVVAPEWRIVADQASIGPYTGVIISVNEQHVFSILSDDIDVDSHETLQIATDRAITQLRSALEARGQQRSVRLLLRGIGLSLVATLLLLFGLWFVARAARRVKARFEQTAQARARRLGLVQLDVQPVLHMFSRTLAKVTVWAAAISLVYLWLTYVLLRFPYTQPWGEQLGSFLIALLTSFGTGIIASVPGIFTVIVIFLLTRVVTRLVMVVFRQVERGDLSVPWLHPDTARATRYLVLVLIWMFAITVAYPYIPGSDTDAFKGVSVLLGLMISLGSAGLVNQVMSGLVVVYSRALRTGEFVKVEDEFGVVTDVGMLATKLLTRKKEEITIPNAVLVAAKTVNYSRLASNGEAQIGATVTIGYDTPWRQVHELLLQAARKTAGLRTDPPPRVWQMALSNFYVEYELVVSLDHPEERVPILSELHTHILDAFNEAGVQIMVPAFESQPENKMIVPKSQWFPKPTREPQPDGNPR